MVKVKKLKPVIYIFFLTFSIVIAIIFVYVYKRTKAEEIVDFKKFLFENKIELDKTAQNLMLLDIQNLTIYMDSNEILAYDDGKPININELLSDEEIVDNIKKIFKISNIEYIDKWDGYIEYGFYDNNFQYGLSYTYDKNKLLGYTYIKYLGDNWYYWFISMPDDNMY